MNSNNTKSCSVCKITQFRTDAENSKLTLGIENTNILKRVLKYKLKQKG